MRIGIISQWYEPETGAAAHPAAIARSLVQRGHEVRVLTGFPSYPLGRVYAGWRRRWSLHELRDGVEVRRVPDIPSHDDSAWRRSASLASFAVSATAQAHWLRDADVCLTYLTPATVGLAARSLSRLFGVPYVLYVQDLWPESVTASGFIKSEVVASGIEAGIGAFLRGLYRNAESLIGISPTMRSTLAERAGKTPVDVIYNWVDEDTFRPAAPTGELPRGRKWFMYAGGIGELQGLDAAVRAVAMLNDRDDIGLVLVGDGVAVPHLRGLAAACGVEDRVLFLGPRSMSAMPALMAEATAQLVSLKDLPLFRGTVPSKLQASMAGGQPVICAVSGDAADLIQRSGGGVAVQPEDPAALMAAMRNVADMSDAARRTMGDRSRRFYDREMCAAVGGKRLEEHLLAAARRRQ